MFNRKMPPQASMEPAPDGHTEPGTEARTNDVGAQGPSATGIPFVALLGPLAGGGSLPISTDPPTQSASSLWCDMGQQGRRAAARRRPEARENKNRRQRINRHMKNHNLTREEAEEKDLASQAKKRRKQHALSTAPVAAETLPEGVVHHSVQAAAAAGPAVFVDVVVSTTV